MTLLRFPLFLATKRNPALTILRTAFLRSGPDFQDSVWHFSGSFEGEHAKVHVEVAPEE